MVHKIENAEWKDVSTLFDLTQRIKGSQSPVFASKLCHFLFPSAFVVVDWTLTGCAGRPYGAFWAEAQHAWLRLSISHRRRLVEELRRAIRQPGSGRYPWATKIVELCIIGARQGKAV